MTASAPLRALSRAAALVVLAALAACASVPAPLPAESSASAAAVAEAPAAAASAASAPEAAPAVAEAASAPAVAGAASAPEAAAVDPLRPEVRLDLDDRAAQIDLWARVRAGFRLTDLDNERVRESERWYAQRPDYVARMTERGSRYLFHIVEEVEKRGMPTEIALLPFIESAFNPEAMSSARASGMWQFIPSTGRNFELTQNVFRDDRRDVLASTRAALDYLQKLYGMFGDWHLALAAYNWGEGNVQRAVARNQRKGKAADYDSLAMPRETRYYVPKLQAVKNIVANPEAFGLGLPALSNHPYFLAVPIERDIDVDLAAKFAGIGLDDFKALNPQMNRPVILAAGTPQVLLPYDNANLFVRALRRHQGPLASWTAWVVPKNLRPADLAKQFGISESELREVNHIPPRMLVRAGSTLLVPRSEARHADVSEHIAENGMVAFVSDTPAQRRIVLKAGKRDSVASVARRYRVSASQVALWNGTSVGANFRPGEKIFVYVARKAASTTAVRKTATSVRKAAAKPVAKAARPAKARTRVAASN